MATGMELMKLARSRLCGEFGYFASAAWTLRFVELKLREYGALGDFCVDDHWNLYFDPDAAVKLHKEEGMQCLMGILVHEIGHLVRRHGQRAQMFAIGEQRLRWNLAADCEINDDIMEESKQTDARLKLPKNHIHPSLFNFPTGLTVEEYYDLLEDKVVEITVNCGSGAHGQKEDWEKQDPKTAPSVFEREAVIRDTARRVKEAGDAPAGWKRWAEQEGVSKVPWYRELASSIRSMVAESRGKIDYTWRFPNRKQDLYGKILLPSMMKPNPDPAVVIDTSGSMSEHDLAQCMTEVKAIFNACGFQAIRYYACDAAVAKKGFARSTKEIELVGGGGTDMGAGIAAALEHKPSCIVVLTDTYSPWPSTPPPCKVIIVAVGEGKRENCPDWAKVIEVGVLKERR